MTLPDSLAARRPLLRRRAAAASTPADAAAREAADPDTDADEDGERPRPRATLVVNPYSSGMTARRERQIVTVLRERLDLVVRRTERPGHAPELAREAVAAGTDVVIACGGDGTANEVLNGLAIDAGTAGSLPRIAVIPAGGTNVLCRSLGLPNNPVRATRMLADAIVEGTTRTITLGRLDERVFMFSAGIGLDGEVVRRIEQRRTGRRPGDLAHLAAIVGIFAAERFRLSDRMTVSSPELEEDLRAGMVMVGNSTPLTYMGQVPLHILPDTTLEGGLDFAAPHQLGALLAIRNGLQAAGLGRTRRRLVSEQAIQLHHDVGELTIECDEPQPVQADGEYLGQRTRIRVRALKDAICLVAPADPPPTTDAPPGD